MSRFKMGRIKPNNRLPAPPLPDATEVTPALAAALLTVYSGTKPLAQVGIDKMSALLKAEPGRFMGYASFLSGTLRSGIHRLGAIRDTGIMGRMIVLHDDSLTDFLKEQT
jgi:hypothetical protein